MTLWGRLRTSRLALAVALAVLVIGPLYLAMAFPVLWREQAALIAMPEQVEVERQVLRNLFGWLAPNVLVLGAILYLALRFFVRRDEI